MSNFKKVLSFDTLGKGWYRLRKPVILFFTLNELFHGKDCKLLRTLLALTGLSAEHNIYLKAPGGFITDFASIPWYMRWLFRPKGKYAKAVVIHDLLYQYWGDRYKADITRGPVDILNTIDSKEFSDLMLIFGMKILGVPAYKRFLFGAAVKFFGSKSYKPTRIRKYGTTKFGAKVKVISDQMAAGTQYPIFTTTPMGGSLDPKNANKHATIIVNETHGTTVTPTNFGRPIMTLVGNRLP